VLKRHALGQALGILDIATEEYRYITIKCNKFQFDGRTVVTCSLSATDMHQQLFDKPFWSAIM
jgi:hypothetical protein